MSITIKKTPPVNAETGEVLFRGTLTLFRFFIFIFGLNFLETLLITSVLRTPSVGNT